MKKFTSIMLIAFLFFAFGSTAYSQVIDFKTNSSSEKKEDKSEDKDSKSETKTMGFGYGFEDVSFKGYEKDPLYKKMKELEKKLEEVKKTTSEKAKKVYAKYGNWEDLDEEDRKKMSDELNAIYEEIKEVSTEYQKIRTELIEKIEKERAEKYKDDPLYQKMIETKKKMQEEQKKFMEGSRDLAMSFGGLWNEMTEEEKKEYYEKMNELKKPYDEAKEEYLKAKKAFEDSIDEENEDEEEEE